MARVPLVRIVVVEDERKMRESIAQAIRLEGWQALEVASGQDVVPLIRKGRFDLMVLDWMLPDCDGLALLRNVRAEAGSLPVLMLTARGSVEDRVVGLDTGADDYLAKPFSMVEMVARCRALLRRPRGHHAPVLQCGDLKLDVGARTAHRGNAEIALTPQETDVLECLMAHKREVVSRDMLEAAVLHRSRTGTASRNMLDVIIVRLRRKIEPEGATKMLQTLHGIGFRLADDER